MYNFRERKSNITHDSFSSSTAQRKEVRSNGQDQDLVAFELFKNVFHLPLIEAAHTFGIESTAFKMRCRKFGIRQWPYRRIKALRKLLDASDHEKGDAHEGTKLYAELTDEYHRMFTIEYYRGGDNIPLPINHRKISKNRRYKRRKIIFEDSSEDESIGFSVERDASMKSYYVNDRYPQRERRTRFDLKVNIDDDELSDTENNRNEYMENDSNDFRDTSNSSCKDSESSNNYSTDTENNTNDCKDTDNFSEDIDDYTELLVPVEEIRDEKIFFSLSLNEVDLPDEENQLPRYNRTYEWEVLEAVQVNLSCTSSKTGIDLSQNLQILDDELISYLIN